MKRRDFIALIGSAAAMWPLGAQAQQAVTPVIGFLSSLTVADGPRVMAAFNLGLSGVGYVEGRNAAIEYRWAAGQYDRLPAMAAELVGRQVAVIAAISGTPTALAAKAATKTIPIVFAIGGDPVAPGLVSNLNRPDGNVTGVTFFTSPLAAKRLELVRELTPKVITIGVLVNPNSPASALEGRSINVAAQAIGQNTRVIEVSTEGQIDDAFATIAREHIGALFVSADPHFMNHRVKLVALAARNSIPAIYADMEIAEAGGLMSYGASRSDAYRQAGSYVGRILKGEKPADLPILLPTKFELGINLKAAKALGLTVPPKLLFTAEQVIE
jgi:putative ABC transport system substrate-binding protein